MLLLPTTGCRRQKSVTGVQGYYADPTIIQDNGRYFIYATIDPWGKDELGVLQTNDFRKFQLRHINWPTKAQCTDSTSSNSMVWAPSVRKLPSGKFYMYVAVGSEIWVGEAENPLGPWKNGKPDGSALITAPDFPAVHNIDPDCFIDDNGDAFLFWGSGFHWKNGRCMAVRLKPDMISFDGLARDITPPNYFEAPHMFKRNGKYYLMYSSGKAIDSSYQIRYSTGMSPFGPWQEGPNDPILSTSVDGVVIGPGHNTVFYSDGNWLILYHRIHPQKKEYVLRELCLDALRFDAEGNILKIVAAKNSRL